MKYLYRSIKILLPRSPLPEITLSSAGDRAPHFGEHCRERLDRSCAKSNEDIQDVRRKWNTHR